MYSASTAIFTNCVVTNNNRVYDNSQYAAIETTTAILQNCSLSSNNLTGLSCVHSTVIDSIVTGNRGHGLATAGDDIYGNSTAITVSNCVITGNASAGVASGDVSYVFDSRINGNGGVGIGGRSIVARRSEASNNSSHGISLDGGNVLIADCLLAGNQADGVNRDGCRGGGGTVSDVEIRDSVLSGNAGRGFYTTDCRPINLNVTSCQIRNNNIGFEFNLSTSTQNGIYSNSITANITANTQFVIKNSGTAAIIATNNFWGEPTTTELTNNIRNLTKVYDSQDNASVGQVILKPYLPTDPFAVPPKITSQPSDVTVAAGATATFSVAATSPTPMTYQWRKGAANLAGQTNSFLTFTAQLSDAATNYNVVVSNSDGSTNSRWATLTVLVPPSITSQPTNLFLPAGSTAAFHVTATGSAPLSYRWYLGAAPLANGGRVSGATSPDLTITSITPPDAGNYWVRVTNSVGSTNSVQARLDLPTPPVITNQPKTQVVAVGGQAVFTVQATGTLPMTYQWYQNGAAIGGATAASLNVANVSPANLGAYTVAITNLAGGIVSASASLWLNGLKMYAGVNVYGPVGGTCAVDYTTNLTEPFTWLPLQNVTIVTNPTVVIDYNSPEQSKRFYRTVPLP